MLIDAHTHILSLAEDAEFTTEYGREGSLCIYRSLGKLPSHRAPTEPEWEASGYSRRGFPVIGPAESLRDHPGFDKIVILAVSPQFLDGELIGTVDSYGITGVPGPPAKLLSVNAHAERVGSTPIPAAKLDGILGDNYARMSGLLP